MPKRTYSPEALAKRAAYSKQWRARNPERAAHLRKRWSDSHPDRLKETRKEWRQRHPEKARLRSAAWRKAKPDLAKALCRAFYQNNKSSCLEKCRARYRSKKSEILSKHKEWRKSNPDKWKESRISYNHRRRARINNAGGNHTTKQWMRILAAHKNRCYWCGAKGTKKQPLTRDHYIPIANNGSNEARNVVPSCLPCNQRKNRRDPIDFARSLGLLL